MINRFLFLITALLLTQTASAQNADEQLVQSLRGGALFNVVVACIAIVLVGLLIAIIRLDRKVSKLEKEAISAIHIAEVINNESGLTTTNTNTNLPQQS